MASVSGARRSDPVWIVELARVRRVRTPMFRYRARRELISCAEVREHLSAARDEEDPGDVPAIVVAHLADCVECRTFEHDIIVLTRHLRIRALEPIPDLSRKIMMRIAPIGSGARPTLKPRVGVTRWVVALVPLGLVVSSLTSGAFAQSQVTPSHPVTRCTQGLTQASHVAR